MLIRKDDQVVVITGDDKGPEPRKVIKVLKERNKVLVEGVNRVYKHLKPSAKNQQGGRLSKEMPVAVSNVMFYNADLKRPVRLGIRINENGQKERFCKVSNKSLGAIGKAKPARVSAKPAPKSEVKPAMARLYEQYNKTIADTIQKKFNISNRLAVPRLEKIVINMGVGKATQDKNILEQATDNLTKIAGQKPVTTKAKTSVAGFRLREGNAIGTKVTLRGARMYEFLDRLVAVALPRIRDFRGINPNSFDGHGNYSLGISEQVIFPEIDADKIQHTLGMDITIVTSAKTDDHARELLTAFGMPFRQPGQRAGGK